MHHTTRSGLFISLSAYLFWGFLPIYWKNLGEVPPVELLAWRVGGCGVFAWLAIAFRKRLAPRSAFSRRNRLLLAAAALLIAVNWGVYIWSVATGRVVEASLGYYINPLVSVVLGVIFFSERIGRMRAAALVLAAAGVAVMTLVTGVFPWVSIVLAVSFGFYGLIVKQLPPEFDSIEILAWETAILAPFAAAYLAVLAGAGTWHFVGFGADVTTLLVLAGAVTLLPLWLFGIGARRLPLGVMGFLQYSAPTTMLLVATLIYGEPFGLLRGTAFALVGVALVLFSSTLRNP